ncbi:hypothetical protein K7G98_39160, partial [Saccharothrix sp. MB29]|nr:hypothetical protein [Saccharothrix sp. MB29]
MADRHGTATVLLDSVSHAVTRRALDPYGNPLDTTPWPVARGFLDKPVSEHTGLTDVGARKYDAATGRFLSVREIVKGDGFVSDGTTAG